jgi:hypothetical protein
MKDQAAIRFPNLKSAAIDSQESKHHKGRLFAALIAKL